MWADEMLLLGLQQRRNGAVRPPHLLPMLVLDFVNLSQVQQGLAQPLQARLNGTHHSREAVVGGVTRLQADLGGNEQLACPGMIAEREADAALAIAVQRRGVEERDPHVQRPMDGRYRRILTQLTALAAGEAGGAQPKPGDIVSGLSQWGSHQRSSSFRSHPSGVLSSCGGGLGLTPRPLSTM